MNWKIVAIIFIIFDLLSAVAFLDQKRWGWLVWHLILAAIWLTIYQSIREKEKEQIK